MGDKVHPSDCVIGGELVRSPWADVPSGNPLLEVDAISRAVFVLVANGEDVTSVGVRLLPGPRETAGVRALRTARRVRRGTLAAIDGRARADKLKMLVPKDTDRWALILKASGAFPDVTELARILQIHRSSIYRTLETTAALLHHHAAEQRTGRN